MRRRNLLKASMVLAAMTGLPASLLASRSFAATTEGKAEPFDFQQLQARAKQMAGTAYKSTAEVLPQTLAELTPLQFNAIQYDPKHSLWNALGGQLDVQFFHVGMGFRQPVRMHSIDPKTQIAQEVHFRPELFEYNQSDVDVTQLKGDLGFAGLKVFKQPNIDKHDVVSFLGASYFRAVDKTGQYGLSARGLAINTFADTREEFPDFTEFWFETPDKEATRFVLYALLDSPSATGAFRFDIDCQAEQVVMVVDAKINARQAIKQLGISPMTSMFACGGHERHTCDFITDAVHDSDRLSMWRSNGEWVCRPLNNPKTLQFNTFADTNPKGFGLVQFDHDFKSYQDTVVWYSRRPSLWVEPTTEWGEGSIGLLEIPTTGETMDNIVCFWNPKQAIEPGTSLDFGYKLYWAAQPPVQAGLAQVHATRSGMGGFTPGWAPGEHWPKRWARRFAVDFGGGPLLAMNGKEPVELVTEATRGEVKDFSITALQPEANVFRAQFDWFPTSDSVEPVNIRAYLRRSDTQEVLSETWLYQYFPPAPQERRYPDWKG